MKLTRIKSIEPYDWTEILGASQSEGYNMVNRLLTDFREGTNRFDAPGEKLFVHLDGNVVVAVAGVNLEQDTSFGKAGRVRRLYVIPKHRSKSFARNLIVEIASFSSREFDVLTVNVGKLAARGFYEHIGFKPVEHTGITHVKELTYNTEDHYIPENCAKRPFKNKRL